jgi:HlyD family secretion protein
MMKTKIETSIDTKLGWLLLALVVVGLLAAGCSAGDEATAADDVDAVAADFSNIATASGRVAPEHWATLAFTGGGRLDWVIEEGAKVAAGDELARLDPADLEQAAAQAQAALAAAEAELALAVSGGSPEERAAAEGAVTVAQGNLAAAEARLAQIEEGASLTVAAAEANLAEAEGAVQAANAERAHALAVLSQVQSSARPEEVAFYQAELARAEAELRLPTNVHDDLIDKGVGGTTEERARFTMEAAQAGRDAASAQLALAQAGPASGDLAAASAGIAAADAQIAIAEAGVQAAETALAQAQAGLRDVDVARAQVTIAQGQLAQAEAERDRLLAGATPEQIVALEAMVDQAEAALAQAESALRKSALTAPMDGVVGNVYLRAGELAMPDEPVVVVGDVSSLLVETTDLNEVDAAQVSLDSPVTLSFDALPGQVIEGRVVRIAPMASDGQGGTNFRAIIEMISPPEALLWGMTAFVDIELE